MASLPSLKKLQTLQKVLQLHGKINNILVSFYEALFQPLHENNHLKNLGKVVLAFCHFNSLKGQTIIFAGKRNTSF